MHESPKLSDQAPCPIAPVGPIRPKAPSLMNESPSVEPWSTTGQHLANLDVWRGLAITFLLSGHFLEVPKMNCGRLGVESYFVLGLLLVSRHLSGEHRAFRPMIGLGTISYSVYLWRQPIFHAKADGRLGAISALAPAILAGAASYFLIERPARRWLNASWAR